MSTQNEKPIIFNSEMVRAILDGRKTQTRRIIKPQPIWEKKQPNSLKAAGWKWKTKKVGLSAWVEIDKFLCELTQYCPYGKVGDTLWMRENMRTLVCQSHNKTWEYGEFEIEYIADKTIIRCPDEHEEWWRHNWHIRPAITIPSIHMPKWAARIFLEITNIRVERVQDIIHKDMRAEGVNGIYCGPGLQDFSYEKPFMNLWNSLNAKRGYGWDKNPFVWIIEFKRVT